MPGEASDCVDEVTLSRRGRRAERAVPTFVRPERRRVSALAAGVTHALSWKLLEARTRELAEARDHLAEALEQHATSDVLRVISSSPGELEPVSTRCWKTRFASATPSLAPCSATTASCILAASVAAPPALAEFRAAARAVPAASRGAQPITCYRQSRCTIALTKQRSPAPACRPGSAAPIHRRCADAQGE